MSAFGALDTEEKVFERRLLNKACKARKRALETEGKSLERKLAACTTNIQSQRKT
jgi:hypothetical protein